MLSKNIDKHNTFKNIFTINLVTCELKKKKRRRKYYTKTNASDNEGQAVKYCNFISQEDDEVNVST